MQRADLLSGQNLKFSGDSQHTFFSFKCCLRVTEQHLIERGMLRSSMICEEVEQLVHFSVFCQVQTDAGRTCIARSET